MNFGLDRDRMVVTWTSGDEDLALALLDLEGFEIARSGSGLADRYRTATGGWERRVAYAAHARTTRRRVAA